MGNLVYMALLIAWYFHLGIPHGWVVLGLLMGDVVHPLVNNVLLPLYMVLLFNFNFMGFDE